ncbi:MAG: hypothetical protein ACRENP_05890 [Longimicrobiales bacterium]
MTTPNVPDIRRTLASVRPELLQDSLTFRAALLLMVGPAASFNVDRMAGRSQIPRSVVAACARRLFDNGVWKPDGPLYAWRSPDDDQFWFDVSVAEGQLCRRTDPLGRIEWAAPGSWRKPYEFDAEDPSTLSVSYRGERESTATPEAKREAREAEVDEIEVPAQPQAETVRRVRPRRAPVPLGGSPPSPPHWLGVAPREELFPGTPWLG